MIYLAGYLILMCAAAGFAWAICRMAAIADNEFPGGTQEQPPPAAGGHSDAEPFSLGAVRRSAWTAGIDLRLTADPAGSVPASENDDGPAATRIPAQRGRARGGQTR